MNVMIVELAIALGIALLVLMHTGRGQVIHDHIESSVGAIAANAAVIIGTAIASGNEEGFRISKLKYAFNYRIKTDGEGPFTLGLSVGLTAAEVAEAMNARPSHSMDEPATERANRRVFPLRFFAVDGTETFRSDSSFLSNVRIPWKDIPEHVNLNWFIFANNALSTGMLVDIHMTLVGEWLRD